MIRRRHGKTPYELLHDKPPDLSKHSGFTNRRTRRIIETIHVDFDELTAMASEHSSSGPALHDMTPVTISSGLVPNPPPSTPFVPPLRSDWDLLFQPMFDESLLKIPTIVLRLGTRLEALLRILSSVFAAHMNMAVYQMDVKTAFLNAPRAWYDMLSSFLISNDFSKGLVDPTLFIRREGNELLLVQIYVDDIIFAASTPELCDLFAKIMCSKSKMFDDGGYFPWWRKSKWMRIKKGNAVDPSTIVFIPADHESVQPWLSNLARRQDPRESFDELTDTTFDFSAFVMNLLNITTLTPELLIGPTFELMKGTCKSLTELEYFCEEVYKATTKKLDWINPKGRKYPHDLRKPLPLVPNSQGRHVIPFHHFINNDLEYLRGGESSRKYSTLITKTKAADYGHIKWIEDLVPNSMWSQVIVSYDKFALWGISHWGKKRRQFYAFVTTRESARDVYSKRRIITVTKVEIVEWQNYKHLDRITLRRDDDILYKFKEGDFHRLWIQDIEDMLLLLVQGKLTNLNVEEHLTFNVSLRMFTRSVVIQRRVEDLQLGVESYQKKLNLTKPDTYRSNLGRIDAYTPYSDPRGFIYENKDKKNRLMRINELHKFSDGTLDDVRTALNDRLKGIRMEYLPQTFWSQRDKANARAMIQAIDKRLKTRRIMQSLERFVSGRPYGGDLRLL
ncbi:retrovirus-related pol polyprotein from transposon TNT 1-94 [Tanacetum coccineum]